MSKPISFATIKNTLTYIILPWDHRVGAITRCPTPQVRYLYSPADDTSVRQETAVYRVTGHGPDLYGGVEFDMTVTAQEWAKIQFLFGADSPYILQEATDGLAWGGYDWDALESDAA